MKQSTIIICIIVSSIVATITTGSIYSIKYNKACEEISVLQNEVDSLTNENEELRLELEAQTSKKEFKRLKLENDFWEFSKTGNSLYGTLLFDDLSNVQNITISFKDEMFNEIKTTESNISLDRLKNKGIAFCNSLEIAKICQLDVEYTDGRSETIIIRIARG